MTSKNIYSSLPTSIIPEFSSTFNDSKYTKWYIDIVSNPDMEGEEHHILPRSLFPEHLKNPENLVVLSLRKHYLAHLLLMKMGVENTKFKYKLFHALKMMSFTRDGIKCNSRLYERFKAQYLKTCYKLIYNESTGEERHHFTEDEIPEGFILRGKPKSNEWKAKITGRTQSEEHIQKRTGNNKGKTFWVNPETGDYSFSHEPPDETWIKQSNNRGRKYGKFRKFHDPITKICKGFRSDEEIPAGWVSGEYHTEERTNQLKDIALNMVKFVDNKNRSHYHDPVTMKQKNFKPGEEIPEGWIKGRLPKDIRSGFSQSDLQKSRAREANQKEYKVTYVDGTEETFKGLVDWVKTKPFTRSQLSYRIKMNRLHEIGILKLEEV